MAWVIQSARQRFVLVRIKPAFERNKYRKNNVFMTVSRNIWLFQRKHASYKLLNSDSCNFKCHCLHIATCFGTQGPFNAYARIKQDIMWFPRIHLCLSFLALILEIYLILSAPESGPTTLILSPYKHTESQVSLDNRLSAQLEKLATWDQNIFFFSTFYPF